MRPGEGDTAVGLVPTKASQMITEPLGAGGTGTQHVVDRAQVDEAKPGPPHERTCSTSPAGGTQSPAGGLGTGPAQTPAPQGSPGQQSVTVPLRSGHSFTPSSNTHSLSSTSPMSSSGPGDTVVLNIPSLPQEVCGVAREQEYARAASLTRSYQSRSPKQGDQASPGQMLEL